MKVFLFVLALLFLSCTVGSSTVRPSKIYESEKSQNMDTVFEVPEQIHARIKEHTAPPLPSHASSVENNSSLNTEENFDTKVRILLHKNIPFHNFFAYGKVRIVSKSLKINISAGSIRALFIDENTAEFSAHGHSAQIELPCTLSFVSGTKIFSNQDKEYRGGIIFSGNKFGLFVNNYIEVEDYLKGVVPLEIGIRGSSDFEALKAQAVAARTYTLSRVLKNIGKDYDLLPTTADQVYGGTNCEYGLSDSAIIATKGVVITKLDGSLLETYYHATCAGKTAAINEVWNSDANSSLISKNDSRQDGTAFCKSANSYSWKEVWSVQQLSQILRKYSRLSGETPFSGTIKSIAVVSRTPSGRVADLAITSEKGTFHYGKDKVRFVLRRPTKDESILKSAIFNIKIQDSQQITAIGHGYGHGIGMCQNGAMERSRDGHDFKQILNAYYSNIKFSQWDEFIKSTYSF